MKQSLYFLLSFICLWMVIILSVKKSYSAYRYILLSATIAIIIMSIYIPYDCKWKRLRYTIGIFLFVISIYIFLDPRNYVKRIINKYQVCDGVKYKEEKIYNYKGRDRVGTVSATLYGDTDKPGFKERYIAKIPEIAKSIEKHMPGWVFRIYIDKNIDPLLPEFNGIELYSMDNPSDGHQGSMWRYLVADENVPWVCVDLDDTVKPELIDYVNSWLKSDKPFIIFADYQSILPMSGKMWGAKPKELPNMSNMIGQHCQTWFGTDEAFLRKEIFPIINIKGYWSPGIHKNPSILLLSLLPIIIVIVMYIYMNRKC
jgi:hypothetical protein